MKKGQTSIRGGIEDFLCPFTSMFITQGAGGSYSHAGTMANDVNDHNGNAKRVPYYAPCTCKCFGIYPSSGQTMWQSLNKVRFANGRIDYATFVICHDESVDSWIGQVVKQGQQIGNMGMKGNATGVHCHIEISQSIDKTWKLNRYNIWCFNNEYDTTDCYFMDGTTILNYKDAGWKHLKDVPVNTCPYKSNGAIKALYDGIRVRTAPSLKKGDTGVMYNADSPTLYYKRVVLADGKWWAEYDRANGGTGYCCLCDANGSNKLWKQV